MTTLNLQLFLVAQLLLLLVDQILQLVTWHNIMAEHHFSPAALLEYQHVDFSTTVPIMGEH